MVAAGRFFPVQMQQSQWAASCSPGEKKETTIDIGSYILEGYFGPQFLINLKFCSSFYD